MQIEKALISGSNVILTGDINANLGSKIIALDQCDKSGNGKLLYDVYTKCDLVPLNTLDICSGVLRGFITMMAKLRSPSQTMCSSVVVASKRKIYLY